MAIPFASLRFPAGRTAGVGHQLPPQHAGAGRSTAYLAPIPASAGRRGLARLSLAATLVGLEIASPRPSPRGQAVRDRRPSPPTARPRHRSATTSRGRVGGDLKVGLGRRPHRRRHALHRLRAGGRRRGAGEPHPLQPLRVREAGVLPRRPRAVRLRRRPQHAQPGRGGGPPIAPVLFFSRRIGLADEDPVQILAGGRVTGRVGAMVGRRAAGAPGRESASLALPCPRPTSPSCASAATSSGAAASASSTRGARRPRRRAARTRPAGSTSCSRPRRRSTSTRTSRRRPRPARGHDDLSYRGRVDYNADRYGLVVEHLVVGDDFNPDVGLMRREDFQRSFVEGRISRRPGGHTVAAASGASSARSTTPPNNDRVLESRSQVGTLELDLMNGDEASVSVERSYEALVEPLELSEGRFVTVGEYNFTIARAKYQLGSEAPRRHRGPRRRRPARSTAGRCSRPPIGGRLDVVRGLTLEPNIVAQLDRRAVAAGPVLAQRRRPASDAAVLAARLAQRAGAVRLR